MSSSSSVFERRKDVCSGSRAVRSPIARSSAGTALFIQRFFAVSVFAALMVSIYAYKIWYIATAAALAVTALFIVLAGFRYRGVVDALVPVGVYFLWLLTTAFWASHPRQTVWFAVADSIGIAVAVLFYLVALNQPHRITGMFIALAFIAIPTTAFIFWRNPEATRSGGYAISILPFVPPFCWADIARRRKPVLSTLALIVTFGLLIFARSRTPILVAAFTTGLAVFAFSRGIPALIKRAVLALVIMVLAFGALVVFRPTREMALITFSRFTHIDIHFGDVYIESEPEVDPVRVDLHRAAKRYGREHLFFGMGYHNFPYYFARDWSPIGRPYTLHSMYETWWVEGGVVCVLIVFVMFYRHFRSLVRAMRGSADSEVRRLARTMIVASLGVFVLGLFHQTHVNPMLYALIGIGAALPRVAPLLLKKKASPERTRLFARSGGTIDRSRLS